MYVRSMGNLSISPAVTNSKSTNFMETEADHIERESDSSISEKDEIF